MAVAAVLTARRVHPSRLLPQVSPQESMQVVATDVDDDGLRALHDHEKRLMVLHMDVTDAAEVDKVVTKV